MHFYRTKLGSNIKNPVENNNFNCSLQPNSKKCKCSVSSNKKTRKKIYSTTSEEKKNKISAHSDDVASAI